jgi:lambda family phage portal protein
MAANFLDRAIAWVAPTRAEKRLRARLMLDGLAKARMMFDGATAGHRGSGWRAVSTDANAEIGIGSGRLRDVARDMVRNNPHASRAVQVISYNVVAKGLFPNAVSSVDRAKEQAEDLIKRHFDTTACDADGRHDLYGLQTLAMRTIVESGEVIIRRRMRRPEDNLPVPFQIQVLEPDYLDTLKDGELPNGNVAVQGIEFDWRGRRVAYWLHREHPGSRGAWTRFESDRIPAEYVAHVFRTDRPGQARGVSWFAPVVLRLRDYADFADAQLVRQKIAACFAAFVTSPDGPGLTGEKTQAGHPLEAFEPGMIERLRDGEEVTFGVPPQVQGYDEYSRATLREIAAGMGISYEALTGDLKGVNFSSGRMGWLEFQRSVDAWREHMLVPQMCQPIADWFLEAMAMQLGRRMPLALEWALPRREMISPAQEIPPIMQAIRGGLSSRSEEQRKLGYDPADLDRIIAEDNARADRLGLVFDSDPRRVSGAGQAHPAEPGQEPED